MSWRKSINRQIAQIYNSKSIKANILKTNLIFLPIRKFQAVFYTHRQTVIYA